MVTITRFSNQILTLSSQKLVLSTLSNYIRCSRWSIGRKFRFFQCIRWRWRVNVCPNGPKYIIQGFFRNRVIPPWSDRERETDRQTLKPWKNAQARLNHCMSMRLEHRTVQLDGAWSSSGLAAIAKYRMLLGAAVGDRQNLTPSRFDFNKEDKSIFITWPRRCFTLTKKES